MLHYSKNLLHKNLERQGMRICTVMGVNYISRVLKLILGIQDLTKIQSGIRKNTKFLDENCIQDKDNRSSGCGIFTKESHQVRESKTVLDSGFHAMDSGLQVLYSGFFISGTWILHSNRQWDSGFLDSIP